MSNRRVKSMAYDDDDGYDDFDDDEYNNGEGADDGLTAEDREQLRLGAIKVREALGTSSQATDAEIQGALWHYYYDVAKSVTFLKSAQVPSETWYPLTIADKHDPSVKKENNKKKPNATSTGKHNLLHFPHIPDCRKERLNRMLDVPSMSSSGLPVLIVLAATDPFICSGSFSAEEFFYDCPWFNIPASRKSEILIESLYPRGGLLGGSSKETKMSKLAALAAKRRLKDNLRANAASQDPNPQQEDNTLRLKAIQVSADAPNHSFDSKERPLHQEASRDQLKEPTEPSRSQILDTRAMENILDNRSENIEATMVYTDIQAAPSAFASILVRNPRPRNPNPFRINPDFLPSETKLFDFTEPSPDDIIAKAQSMKATHLQKAKQKEPAKLKNDTNIDVSNLSIQEPAKIKNKNLNVAAEYDKSKRKNAANFVVIGHVDAGKSTLMGRLLFDLKAVDQRTMDKYKKEAERIGKGSFAFAWVLDQGSEERTRGVTIDIATNKFETEKTSFTILDAPGHRDFVPNMIAGASQADFAVLVIDASTGNFESGLKGQTKEHALLVRSIGVHRIIVAVNKMDMADWSQDRFQEIKQQMSGFLTSAGFQPKNVAFVPCSGLEGGNILFKTTDSNASWYTGPTLVEELDMSEPTTYAIDKPFRMTIGDVFRGGVQNPLSVSGRLEAGNVQVGEQIVIMPSAEKAFVKTLEVDDEPQEWAVAGQNVVLHLTDIDAVHLKIGDVLCSPTSPIKNITSFTAKVLAFDHLTPMNLDIHRGRLHIPGRLAQLVASLEKSTGAVMKKKPKIVQPGSVVRVIVELDQAVPLEAPGRVVLRAGGETVAAGLIE